MNNLFAVELEQWQHYHTVHVKSVQTQEIIVEIEESENKYSILEDDISEGEYENIIDRDSMQNQRKISIIDLYKYFPKDIQINRLFKITYKTTHMLLVVLI